MPAFLRLLIAFMLVTAATGCGTGFVDGWREEKAPTGTPAERCERREGYSWLNDECQKDSGLDLGDVTAEEQCNQIAEAGWFDSSCIAYKDLNADQCGTIAAWGWLADRCRPRAEIDCLAAPGKTYLNSRCLDRPTLAVEGALTQSIVAGFAMEPLTVAPAAGSTAAISSQTCPGFFKLTANKLESTTGTELAVAINSCTASIEAKSQFASSEPVTVTVKIEDGFLRVCASQPLNNTVRLIRNAIDAATDCASAATALAKLPGLDFNGGLVADLSPLRGLRNLKKLMLDTNRVEDLRPLSGLTGLVYLDISHNPVADLRPLADLVQLTTVYADGTPVAAAADPVKCPKDAKSPGVAAFCTAIQGQ